jgi:hypothetical protein
MDKDEQITDRIVVSTTASAATACRACSARRLRTPVGAPAPLTTD